MKLTGGDMGGTTSNSTPMHGLGYGLPLSRLYARYDGHYDHSLLLVFLFLFCCCRYFGGEIQIQSMDGHGTDAFIYLKALETDARETLPIFNSNSVSKIKDVKNQVEDWTTER